MLKSFLKEIVALTVGKQAEPIAELLKTKSHVNEFNIAKKLDLTINQTRNILYKISNYGLVSSVRKKDKKKGWYTYFWKFEISKCLDFLRDLLKKRIDEVHKQILERKKSIFYICERCNIEVDEEKALLMDFTCEECGDIFTVKDGSKIIRDLERELMRAQEKLKIVDLEIEKEKLVIEKKKSREFKKVEKEKKAKRDVAAAKRKAAKKKLAKKKVVKKKTIKKKPAKKKAAKKPVKKKAVKKVTKKKTPRKKAVKKRVVGKKAVKKRRR